MKLLAGWSLQSHNLGMRNGWHLKSFFRTLFNVNAGKYDIETTAEGVTQAHATKVVEKVTPEKVGIHQLPGDHPTVAAADDIKQLEPQVQVINASEVNGGSCAKTEKQDDHIPGVDSGWALVTAFVAFSCHFIMDGFAYTTGVFYVEFLEVFQESKGTTAWISSLLYGTLCAAGAIGSILISQWGCRSVLLLGTVISSAGMVITAFTNNINVVFVTLGTVAGTGLGLIFTAAVVVVSFNFQRFRTFTMGLTIAGGSFGTIVYPWITRAFIESFGWRGALIICAGINLNLAVLAMLVPARSPLEQEQTSAKEGQEKHKKTLRETLHLHLFQSLVFNLLAVNCLLFNFALMLMYTHISAYALSLDLGQNVADLLISLLGIAGLLGRLGLGALGQLQSVNIPMLYVGCYIIAGLAIITCGLFTTTPGVACSVIVFGLFAAAYGPILSEVTFIIAGAQEFTHAYGYLMVYQGVGTVIGPPIAGMVYDVTHLYKVSFFLGGCVLILSSLIMSPHFCFSKQFRSEQAVEVDGNEEKDTVTRF